MAKHSGFVGSPITFTVQSANLWSPDSPTLYDVSIKMGTDNITTYTGFRTVSKDRANGVQRVFLVSLSAST